MSYENLGSMNIGTAQAAVYSVDGGTNFRWARLDGLTAQAYDTNYADPALAIEAAWSWLNTQGGGTLRTRGPGETWTAQTQINSQGDDVTWLSDWGLRIRAMNALNTNLIMVDHDRIWFVGLYLDGNKANQTGGHDYSGIFTWPGVGSEVYDVYVDRCRIINFYKNSIEFGHARRVGVWRSLLTGGDYNGISISRNCQYAWAEDNYINDFSDVGITCYDLYEQNRHVHIRGNTIENINGTTGFSNSHWGIGVEGIAEDIDITHNIIIDCQGVGIAVSNLAYQKKRVDVSHNKLFECGDTDGWLTGILFCRVDDGICSYNSIMTATTGIYGDNMNDCIIAGNRIQATTAMDLNRAACVRPMIMGNNWEGSTNNATIAGATNERVTSNLDINGAWWAGDDPG